MIAVRPGWILYLPRPWSMEISLPHPPAPWSPSKAVMCFPCVYYTMQFSLMLALENHSRHSGLNALEVSGIHGMGRGCFSISARFLCFSWIRSDGAAVHPHASIGSPRVLVYISPLLLTHCNEIVHQIHCLIVYPLLVSKAKTLNRGNYFSSGFMPHSKHIIPAICFNFTLGWNLNIQHRAFFKFLFLPQASFIM